MLQDGTESGYCPRCGKRVQSRRSGSKWSVASGGRPFGRAPGRLGAGEDLLSCDGEVNVAQVVAPGIMDVVSSGRPFVCMLSVW